MTMTTMNPLLADSPNQWTDVCRVDRLAFDRGACALVGSEQVALFRISSTGEVFAISNYDPFGRAFVMSRGIVGTRGDIVKVASPMYKQAFDLRTGVCLDQPDVKLRTYATRVVGNMVQVRGRTAQRMPVPAGRLRHSTTVANGSICDRPLSGYRIATCEFRERERLANLLAAEGATVVSCPLVRTAAADDSAAVEAWLRALAAGAMSASVFYTGEGVRRLLAAADVIGLRSEVVAALAQQETLTRGPKPARALREAGILPTRPIDEPTSAGVFEALSALRLEGRTIGVQLYPRPSSKHLVRQLAAARFDVRPIWPYRYEAACDESVLRDLAARLAHGSIDLVVFTSRAQVDALYTAAARFGLKPLVESGLRRTRIAAIGPVVASALRARGARPSIVPSDLFFMKSLVKDIVANVKTTSAA